MRSMRIAKDLLTESCLRQFYAVWCKYSIELEMWDIYRVVQIFD